MALGAAYITVHADTAPFAKELVRDIKAILKATENFVKADVDRLGQSISQGIGGGIRRNSHHVQNSIKQTLDVDRGGLGKMLSFGFGSLGVKAGDAFAKGFSAVGNAVATGLENTVKTAGNLFGSIFNVSTSSIAGASAMVALMLFFSTTVLPMVISAVIALAGALSNLLGLFAIIPAALGVILAIILPLVAAFQGFGEAVGAVISKDPKKIAEAMKGLTPAARSVIKELQKLMPLFSKLADIAQEAFFKPLVGDLTALVKRASLPMLHGFKIVGAAAGDLVSGVLAALSRPEMVIFFDNLFESAALALVTLKQPIIDLVTAFALMAQASLPAFQLLIEGLGGFLTKFSAWITANIEDGSFQAFLDKALATLQDVGDLIGAVTQLFKVMFQGTEEGGRTFLQLVTFAVRELTKFFESERGQRALQAMIDLAVVFGLSLGGVILFASTLADQLHIVAGILRAIIKLLSGVDIRKLNVGGVSGGTIGQGLGVRGAAAGMIVRSPELVQVGEGGAPEVIIPLNDRSRAQELADQSGLSSMLRGNGGNITLIAYIGGEQVEAYVQRKIESAFGGQSRALAYGARTGV